MTYQTLKILKNKSTDMCGVFIPISWALDHLNITHLLLKVQDVF